MRYEDFLASKSTIAVPTGIKDVKPIHEMLFPFQRDIVKWSLNRGRAAIFADCGMGKTFMQLEWARQIPGDVLIFCPLAVAEQTIREGKKIGVEVKRAFQQSDCVSGISITNYDRLDKFSLSKFEGIVLDESSILKSIDGKTRTALIAGCQSIPFRLACTATPAPNDYMELGNHAEFLGIMRQIEVLAMFFFHDGGETQNWTLKGHAEDAFWKWVCSWSVMIRKPSDLGYQDDGFVLPPMEMHEVVVRSNNPSEGMLFAMPAATLGERLSARRESTAERAEAMAGIVNGTSGPFLVWCNLNVESEQMARLIPVAVEVRGSDSNESKEKSVRDFIDGKIRCLISKPSMTGYGVNLQHCSNVGFLGLSDSYEQFYQAVRRCWRFGQKKKVSCYIVIADTEGAVLENIKRKEGDSLKMAENMVKHMKHISSGIIHGSSTNEKEDYKTGERSGDGWKVILGDCVDSMSEMKIDSIGYSVYSPPFASLYTYSNQDRDMGNCKGVDEFFKHYSFMVEQLFRITMPGRLTSFHCMNLPTSKFRDGFIGIRDFRGELIRHYQDKGWIFHSEVVIWKDPVTAMQRTKALGLLHKQLKKDACMSRQGIPDYVVTMRKPGENPVKVSNTSESFPVELWQQYASPVWMDINPSDTLQFRSAREDKDEKHICPLQLEVIRRCIKLWSREGDTVLSPFCGIGSEGHEAIRARRKFIGLELKESYYRMACMNLEATVKEMTEGMLFNE